MSEHYADLQVEIYMQGAAGRKPELPLAVEELEAAAREILDPAAHGYVAGSAGAELTEADNRRAFEHWQIVPRHLRDVGRRDPGLELLERRIPAPVLLAPIGALGILHDEADLAAARAAASLRLPLVLSTLSSRPLEAVAEAMGDAPRWFQLYWPASEAVTRSLLRRADAAGYGAVVVTLDTRLPGWRERDLSEAYLPFLQGEGLANYFTDPAFAEELGAPPAENPEAAVRHWAEIFADPSHTWDDLAGLVESSPLPVLVKGVLHPDDAERAVEAGVAGAVVSNHGGRQLDGSIPALRALPGVVDAVGDDVPVLFDSGIRRGPDAIKALALGATAVLVGRPWVWGLALAGEEGVRTVLQRFLADLDVAMAQAGCADLADLSRDLLVPAG